ncbi:uncharacterized protein J4E88_009353 [Alternaria novae-zelandiae]|uniref:uncharacterized protein n=1 Tax=Alternaria novae-zelandiae TaxID=430562 RepID=UPI0020C2D125|nr:uncharacterized protein J4E88_009353 [Alternaria novae-zelandiae]KAI4671319.1 hypothetical protein J4E88_009353 [Alternaria novae-zelandiae]
MKGDIEGLKYLFTTGSAGPRDVSNSRGYSLLRWALYGGMHNYETVHFLLNQGAHVDEISYDNVWDFMMRGKCNEVETHALRCITEGGEGDWLEEQNFPLVHRIIFGLSSKSLEVELKENPNAIYVTDAQGRNALAWATARVQLQEMALLLQHGADPNNMDITGRTPVLHAVDSHDPACLRLILTGGGNPNLKPPKGLFRSSPLTAAGFAGETSLLKLLLEFGAEPNARNPEGLTALHSVAHRCYDYITTLRFGGPQLLPIIAENADISTMNILASSHPLKLALDLSTDSLSKGTAILEQRRDYSEKLSEAFEELVTIAQAEESIAGMSDLDASTPRVFLARHGETEWTKNGRYTGITDIELTPYGLEQVTATATLLVGHGKLIDPAQVHRIYVSPRKRAQQTFQCLFNSSEEHFSLSIDDEKVSVTEDIAEWDYGAYEGLKVEEIRDLRKGKGLDQTCTWNIWRDGCESGESAQQVSDRLDRLICEIRDIQSPAMNGERPVDIVLVAHGLVLRCFLKRWLGLPLDASFPVMYSPGAIGVLGYKNHNLAEPAFFLGVALPSHK